MTEQEYKQKRRECWDEFLRKHVISRADGVTSDAFIMAFDRAYALGKQEKEATMTKYYFMSYMFDAADGQHTASCTCKAENPTLKGLRNLIAKYNDADAETVVIISIKDLTKKEYEMLNNDNDD